MAADDLFSKDKETHDDLFNAKAISPKYFEGLEVFWNSRDVTISTINLRSYWLNIDNYQSGENMADKRRGDFETLIHKATNKVGICLHHTGGNLRGDIETITGARKNASVPFVISRTGIIYQLLDPDKELAWHLGSKFSYWYHHNQIIGIELSNYGSAPKQEISE